MFWDPTMILIIPALILTMIAQSRVQSAYQKYSRIRNMRGMTGAEAAMHILRRNGLNDVKVEATHGTLSDHYDPRTRTVRLSAGIYQGNSIASIAVAAHECGHALQHHLGYVPLSFRSAFFPVVNISSKAAMPLLLLGFFLRSAGLMDVGIVLFSAVVIFHLITLPVEFNASSRAIVQIEENGFLAMDEIGGAKKVLNAAALTYVASAAMAALQLLRFIILRNSRD
jgi:Zn-dependent membrane protease YugP